MVHWFVGSKTRLQTFELTLATKANEKQKDDRLAAFKLECLLEEARITDQESADVALSSFLSGIKGGRGGGGLSPKHRRKGF